MNTLLRRLMNKKRDEKFDMECLTCDELFEGLKFGMLKAINNYKIFEGTTIEGISLMEESKKRRAKGKDGELYPEFDLYVKIENGKLTKPANVLFNVDPFEVTLMVAHFGCITTSHPEELTKALIEFMIKKFPDGKYEKERKKYFKDFKKRYKKEGVLVYTNI